MTDLPDTKDIEGYVYATKSSRRQVARMSIRAGDNGVWVHIYGEDQAVFGSAPLSHADIEPPLGRAPRKITLPDGTVFETEDHDGFAQLVGHTAGSTLHAYESFRPRLIAVVAVCLAAIWVLWRYGLDIMASIAIAFTPPAVIEQIDIGSMRTMDLIMAEPSELSEEDKEHVTRIYETLVTALPEEDRQDHSFELLFRDLPGMGPNAFALPGGTMVMTDEFVKRFRQPDVMASVLGHEIGHVVDEHGLRRLYRSLSTYVLISFLAGDTGAILEDVILEGNLLLSLSFSRAQETSADEFGMTLAKTAGFDPNGLRFFFDTLRKDYGDDEPAQWMSTHPSSADRVQAIDAFIDGL